MKIANDHRIRRARMRVVPEIFAGAATIATLVLFNMAQPGDHATDLAAKSFADVPAAIGFATDDPSDPGGVPQPGPDDFPTNPGWSSQSDPGWNVSPGWDFQPAPEN